MTTIKAAAEPNLLPCPFCGAPARTDLLPHACGPGWVQCSSCECDQPMSDTLEEAVTRWNTRASAPAGNGDVREALEKIANDVIGIQDYLPNEDDRNTLGFAAHYLRKFAAQPLEAEPVATPQEAHDAIYLRGWNEAIERATELLEADGWQTPTETIRTLLEAASPSPRADVPTIDSVPSCGQENDYRRAQPRADAPGGSDRDG